MSTPPQFMYPPLLSTTIDDHERRIRILEMGDPYSIAARMASIPALIEQVAPPIIDDYVDNAFSATWANDQNLKSWLNAYDANLRQWMQVVNQWVYDFGYFMIHQHEFYVHGMGSAPGPMWPWPAFPLASPITLFNPADYLGLMSPDVQLPYREEGS